MHDINELEVDVAYPFLMRVLDHYEARRLDRTGFLKVLRMIESYVFRRSICGIPTNSLNKTFAGLYAGSRLANQNSQEYVERIADSLACYDSYRRFPRDDEFARELMIKDIYHTRSCYLLRKLENHGRTEKIALPDPLITIEHILPQTENLRPEWKEMLGPDWKKQQSAWCHTLGNLTLTSYNSSFSDRPFLEKRDLRIDGIGFAHSPFRLNQEVRDQAQWNAQTIQTRARHLAEGACQVWVWPHYVTPENESAA